MWKLLSNDPNTRNRYLSHFSDTGSNKCNGKLKNRELNIPYRFFSVYSKQCSTARVYKPFDKKISSFLLYEQVEEPGYVLR